jgi:hypothetical protein
MGSPYKRTCFEKDSIQVVEALSQEELMRVEGQRRVENCLVVVVVVVVQNCLDTDTNAGGKGSLERDVAAANEWAQNLDRD